ncbi:DedA family protein [Mesorhizobium sp. DCY119]|uniref:DedA family protein n=1 Tax=Mesorhizobium sp. DCY119 TaxID=2108445 RepID=UPI000E6BF25E|nr:DedA family protein [Mesorhizobium sp. DCY119]RJG46712.1 DedA family protein [Mesorhizobium sp. DCY119]
MIGPVATMLGLGLLGAGVLAFTEKILPVPPSHVLLLFLGMTAAPNSETLASLLLITALGSTVGSMFWYGMGRWLGSDRAGRLVERFGKYLFLPKATYQRLAQAYRGNQFRVTLLAQLVPTVRIYLAIPAGAWRLAGLPFIVATFCGTLVWNAAFLGAGYLMRDAGQDPVTIGFRIVAVVLVLEAAFLAALRYGAVGRIRALQRAVAFRRRGR